MTAAYDTYDYPSFWKGRHYEHESEVWAVKYLLQKIPKINSIIDIGSGYGRLAPCYFYRCKKIVLLDPSSKLLNLAKKYIKSKKIHFIHSKLENLNKNIGKFDLILMIRVLHHIKDLDCTFLKIEKLLNNRGYLILEFPNKRHFKATLFEMFKGNFTFPIDIFPKDIRCSKNIKKKTLPFINYHPDDIIKRLNNNHFEVIEKVSVSNLRHRFIKKYIPLDTLLFIDQLFFRFFSFFNFGPSILILARKNL